MTASSSENSGISRPLRQRIITLATRLREEGVRVTTAEVIDAVAAISAISVFNRKEFYYALRSTLVKSSRDYSIFDGLFADVFSILGTEGILGREGSIPASLEEVFLAEEKSLQENTEDERNKTEELLQSELQEERLSVQNAEKRVFAIYSSTGVTGILKEQDPLAVRRIKRIARKFERRIATRAGLRYSSTRLHKAIDLRRTLKSMIGRDVLLFRSRKYTRTKLLVLYDISGSMKQYLSYFVDIIFGLQRSIRSCEQFIFGTKLVNITEAIMSRNYAGTCEVISNITSSLDGGTNIGLCLQTLLEHYANRLSPRVVTMIVSDGWDTGNIELLTESLRRIKRSSSGFLIWLNPLVDMPNYEPSCVGMTAAMPFIDVFSSPSLFKSDSIFLKTFPYQMNLKK